MDSLFLDLEKTLRSDLKNILNVLFAEGFYCTLVGGATRDFILTNEISNDLDFEIRHKRSFNSDEWENKLSSLKIELDKDFLVKKLPFNIFTIDYKGYSLEFSTPRKETYRQAQSYGHSDFSIEMASDYTYDVSFSRRDFTLNAIGLELKEESSTVVDPYNGIKDLSKRELKPCGKDFTKDPVRLFRSIRFSISKKFDYSLELKESFSNFNLSDVSAFYFFKESYKAGLVKFVSTLFKIVDKYNIAISEDLKIFKELAALNSDSDIFDDQLLIDSMARSDIFDIEKAKQVARLGHIKLKRVELDFKSVELEEKVNLLSFKRLKESIESISYLEAFKLKEFLELKEYVEFYDKNPSVFINKDLSFKELRDLLSFNYNRSKQSSFVNENCQSMQLRSYYSFIFRLKAYFSI